MYGIYDNHLGVLVNKMFFKLEANRKADSLVEVLSLLFLTTPSHIKAEDSWASGISPKKKIENLSTTELLTYTVCRIKRVPSITIVEFKKPFKSDLKLIDSFKDNYLGTIVEKVSKSHLIELANLQTKIRSREYLSSSIHPSFNAIKNNFVNSDLTDQDFDEFLKLYKLSIKPVDDWILLKQDDIKKEIEPLTKFIKRDF